MLTFKRARGNNLSPAQNHFNNSIAKILVASEHTNGLLKMRFGSLNELRLSISNSAEASFACDWISACIVINNLVIEEGGPMEDFPDETAASDGALSPSENDERRAELDMFGFQIRDLLFVAFCAEKGY